MGTEQAVAGYGQVRLISPYEIHTLTELRIEQNLNEHGRLTARGIIPDDKQDTYIHIPVSYQSIAVQEVNDKGEPGRILFQGLVQEININAVQGIYYLELSAITHSILLDLEPRSRSFAGDNGTYLDIIDTVLAAYDGADKLDNALDKERPEGMVLQYKETDWAFIRRIASRFGAAIFPEITAASPKLFIGIPEGRYWELLSQPYSIQRDMAGEKELRTSAIHDAHSIDGTIYTVETGQLYKLGDKVEFQGKEFTVIASTGHFQAGHLVYEYRLMPTGKAWQKPLYNIPLIGSSLEGTVLEVKGSEIQVHLSIDGEQRKEVKHWLAYESPYTAEGHGGWYCMPEAGDTVQVYFPAATEESAVATSLRRTSPLPAQASSPDTKIWSTPAGKEMKLGTSDFTVSASRGRVYLKLEDQSGVTVQSEEDLLFTSRTNLRGTMNRLTAQAGEAIYMRCGSSSIILDGEADIRGERLRVEGLKKSPVFVEDLPPVPEAPFVGEAADTQQTAETKNGAKIGVMDTVQLALNVAGVLPGVGFAAVAAKAGIAAAKRDFTGAALAVASALPFVGWVANAANIARSSLASAGNLRQASFQSMIDAMQRAGMELAGMGFIGKMFTAARGMQSDMTAEEWAERLKGAMQPVSYLPDHYVDTNMMIREVKKSLNWSDDLTQDVVNAVVERRDTDDTVKAMKKKYDVNVLQGLAYITTSYHAEDAGMSFNELFVDNTYRSSEVPYIGNNSAQGMSLGSTGLKKFNGVNIPNKTGQYTNFKNIMKDANINLNPQNYKFAREEVPELSTGYGSVGRGFFNGRYRLDRIADEPFIQFNRSGGGGAGASNVKYSRWVPEGWQKVFETKSLYQLAKENGWTLGKQTINSSNERKAFIFNSDGDKIGEAHLGHKLKGKVVQDHFHLNSEVENIHHVLPDK
ncbi:hypothetical protein EHV15_23200 [Paenibacillus oralis]|uniref:Gp5/Type VI secretion system Vgr protein OB-fold domain-containing protein n=1 Tax=Paenibacillus oralis TaxID=2490856 RepID=A0A3P3U7E5_9BACL|nr:contractile injection system protein, VgrG/Pvc8 family [Paenibacillus oralis]RRJ65498.1 hypothetical protein EHV15_23200 [Paenibacillus oralis]